MGRFLVGLLAGLLLLPTAFAQSQHVLSPAAMAIARDQGQARVVVMLKTSGERDAPSPRTARVAGGVGFEKVELKHGRDCPRHRPGLFLEDLCARCWCSQQG